jgi:GT2 family glycosyltransferase
LKNPLDLVEANLDIIGLPTPICDGKIIVWNAFMRDEATKMYKPIKLNGKEPENDIIECDAVGGGCLLVKRKVFETVKAPFKDAVDEWGMRAFEHDLEFCRRAKESGFHVFFAFNYRCEHIKEVGMKAFAEAKQNL